MSSSEDENGLQTGAKKRRVLRACDACRRKKGDGPEVQSDRCTHCVQSKIECTYDQATRKRGPPKNYVEGLESRVEKLEALLAKVAPGTDFTQELGERFDKRTWTKTNRAPSTRVDTTTSNTINHNNTPTSPHAVSLTSPKTLLADRYLSPDAEDGFEPSDDELPDKELGGTLSERLQRLELRPGGPRFLGKSSGVPLVQTVLAAKRELAGVNAVQESLTGSVLRRRPEFWDISPWEAHDLRRHQTSLQELNYQFPDADLIPLLVRSYFRRVNINLPLLHRPTFERDVASRRYVHDKGFAAVFLLVCAVGSRFVDDERVLVEGETQPASAGWKWFNQVQMVRKSFWSAPRLTDIQMYVLAVMFLMGSSAPQACWSIAGLGIRYAQDVGVHRKKLFTTKPSADQELWKRAFWVLICFDRLNSCMLGRPCAIQDEDFDVDLPIECDDEYWETSNPEDAFKQPPGKPSRIAAFLAAIRLNQILAFAMRTLYSINKSKVLLGFVGHQWEENIVSELDSALNKFVDTIPDHLRWDPTREDEKTFNQSAMLYSLYYYVQIVIHRPFIPKAGKTSPRGIPSLAICTNAARSLARVVDLQQTRTQAPNPIQVMLSFTAGVVLLLNVWGGKRAGLLTDYSKEMTEVHKCMNALKRCEKHWHSAGRFFDILRELASLGELPLPKGSPPSLKREHDTIEDTPSPDSFGLQGFPSPSPYDERPIAGLRRAAHPRTPSGAPADGSGPHSRESSTSLGSLPVRSEDLGRIPLYSAFALPVVAEPESLGAPADAGAQTQWYTPPQDPQQQQQPGAYYGAPAQQAVSPPEMWGADPLYSQMMDTLFASAPGPNCAGLNQYQPPQPQPMTGVQNGEMGNGYGAGAPGMAQGQQGQSQPPVVAQDTLSMWSSAPVGFELDDWGSYLTGMSAMNGQQQAQAVFGQGGPLG